MRIFLKSQDHSGSAYMNENRSWLLAGRILASIRHWITQKVETNGIMSWFALFCTSCGQSYSVTRAIAPDVFRSSSFTTRVVAPAKVQTRSQNFINVSCSLQRRMILSLKNVVFRLPDDGTWNQ